MANEKIYIIEDDIHGYIVKRGAHASLVRYSLGGVEYEIDMLNEEFIIIEEIEEEY